MNRIRCLLVGHIFKWADIVHLNGTMFIGKCQRCGKLEVQI